MNLGPFHAIGVDVGGTKIAAGLVSFPEARVAARRRTATRPERGGEAVLCDVERLAEELSAEGRGRSLRVEGIGVGVCELVDLAGNVRSANAVDWRSLHVRERLSRFGAVVIEADVRAAALAEAAFGAGRGFEQLLYVTVGTDISSALVLGGEPFTGARGLTGTLASSPLPRPSESSEDPGPTIEDISSGPAIAARYGARSGRTVRSAEEVLAAAASGDAAAAAVVRFGGEALGAAVGWLVNVLDPEAVVLGGGLGLGGGMYWESFVASARRHIWSEIHRELPILQGALGPDAGLIGAAAAVGKRAGRGGEGRDRDASREGAAP